MNFFGIVFLSVLPLISVSVQIGDSRADTVSYYYNEGVDHYKNEDFIKASAYFYFTWKMDPWSSDVRESKKRAFEKINRLNPENIEIYLLPMKNLFIWFHLSFLILGSALFFIGVLRKKKKIIYSSIVMFLISSSSLLYFFKIRRLEKIEEVFIIERTEIQEQPAFGSESIEVVEAGFPVKLIDTRSNWLKIKFNGYEGWIKKESVLSL